MSTKCSCTAARFPWVCLWDFLASHLRGALRSFYRYYQERRHFQAITRAHLSIPSCFLFRLMTGCRRSMDIYGSDRCDRHSFLIEMMYICQNHRMLCYRKDSIKKSDFSFSQSSNHRNHCTLLILNLCDEIISIITT